MMPLARFLAWFGWCDANNTGVYRERTNPGLPPRYTGGADESNRLTAGLGLRPLNPAARYGPRLFY